jgi:ABC-2 type transport system ATP-binding protein
LIIEVENLTVKYGKLSALSEVSFITKAGAVGLLGPNGAGKTTLIKTLLGFLKPASGHASALGIDASRFSLEVRRRVGYLPEEDALIPGFSGIGFVAYAGELTGMAYSDAIERAHELLYYVGLKEARYRRVETYSSGMRQRVKLAQALVHDPELVLLDEPTIGMDPTGRKEILDLIKDIAENKGINVLLSSHILHDVEYVCQQVVVLNRGEVVASGDLSDLLGSEEEVYEVRIKGERDGFTSALKRKGARVYFDEEAGLLRIYMKREAGTFPLFEAARSVGVELRHLLATKKTLEDLFVKVVEG